jgi:hypothetical protein
VITVVSQLNNSIYTTAFLAKLGFLKSTMQTLHKTTAHGVGIDYKSRTIAVADQNPGEQPIFPAAVCFIKVLSQLVAVSGATDRSLFVEFCAGGPISILGKTGMASIDVSAVLAMIRNVFCALSGASSSGASVILSGKFEQNYDATSVSYAMFKKFGSRNFISSHITEAGAVRRAGAISQLVALKADIVILLDEGFSGRELASLDTGNFFVIGVSSRRDAMLFMDISIPVDASVPELKYYFTELAFSALAHGSRMRADKAAIAKATLFQQITF